MRDINLVEQNVISGGACPFIDAFGGGSTVVVIPNGFHPGDHN